MHYQEYLPDPGLTRIVRCFWVSSGRQDGLSRILPDGCMDFIFNFGSPIISSSASRTYRNTFTAFIVGNMTTPTLSRAERNNELLGIRFNPAGLYTLLKMPLCQFTDDVVDLENFKPFGQWMDQLADHPDTDHRLKCLNQLLLSQINSPPNFPAVDIALRTIYGSRGQVRIAALEEVARLSRRQLERQFMTVVGVSPKQVARIAQFEHMLGLLRSRGEESLLQLAIDGGYNDHAHFTKSFKEFAGVTPQEFVTKR
jgi:AraC-like DNA-binding protein